MIETTKWCNAHSIHTSSFEIIKYPINLYHKLLYLNNHVITSKKYNILPFDMKRIKLIPFISL